MTLKELLIQIDEIIDDVKETDQLTTINLKIYKPSKKQNHSFLLILKPQIPKNNIL